VLQWSAHFFLLKNYLSFNLYFQAVYPAFYALYVSRERLSSVQAMQFSNGLTNPIGLWLGHLMFDTISSVLLSTIIIIIFATVAHQFYGLGFLVRLLHSFWEQILNTHLNSVARPRTLWSCRSALRVLSILDGLIPARGICDRCRVPICDLYCKQDPHIIYACLTVGFPLSFMYLPTYLFLPLAQPTNRVIPSPSLILRSHS
jgi:hypothetical protein